MAIRLKGLKNFLDNTGIGAGIRSAVTTAVGSIPGVGPIATNLLNKIPAAIKPLPGSKAEKILGESIQQKVDDSSIDNEEIPSLVASQAAMLVDSDPNDPRFPITGGSDTGKGGGVGKKGGYDPEQTRKDGTGWKMPKITFDGVIKAIQDNFLFLIGALVVIAVFMRVPFLKKLVMGGYTAGRNYARRSYSNYRARRSRKK